MIALQCAMHATCDRPVTHVDVKGFVYCEPHGEQRKSVQPCRKLTTTEIAKLGRGETIAYRRTRKAKPTTPALNAEQHAALAAFAAKYGRTWKSVLLGKWSNGSDDREPMGGLLRQVRNTFGPSWLEKFRFDDETRAAAIVETLKPDELPITNEQIKAVALAANKSGDRELTQLCLKALGRRPEDADPAARQAVAVRLQVPRCAASMGCLCAGHARGNDVLAACDTREGEDCDECGAFIPSTERDTINASHDESCSLHPSNSVEPTYAKPEDEPAPRAEITRYAVQANGTHNRGFSIEGVNVLVSGDDDDKIARIAGDLSEAATALERARARHAELQAEIDRQCKLNADLQRHVPPTRPAQILSIGCVRFDERGQLWLLSSQTKGWSAFGVILRDWDDLFRRYNVRVSAGGIDGTGPFWTVEALAPQKENAS